MKLPLLLVVSLVAGAARARICEVVPPPKCSEDQMLCPLGVDSSTTCDLGSSCEPMTDASGCSLACPCLFEEQACPPPPPPAGTEQTCPDADLCLPAYEHSGNPYVEPPNPNGAPLQGICQVQCSKHCEAQGMQTCPPDFDTNGCMLPEVCLVPEQECPQPVRDSMGCQIFYEEPECSEGQAPCPGLEDQYGCVGQASCVSEGSECPQQTYSNGCPILEPKECEPNTQATCPGGLDSKGCQMEETCVAYSPEDPCGPLCPVSCGPDALSCPGAPDPTCPAPDVCNPATNYDGCPLFCDLHVDSSSQQVCQDVSSSTGCLTAPYALALEDSQGCPVQCPKTCGPGQLVCQGPPTEPGMCPAYADFCTEAVDSEGCQAYCPIYPDAGETVCQDMDENQCLGAPYTVPEGQSCP